MSTKAKGTEVPTHVVIGEQSVEVEQFVWREGRSAFPMATHAGTFKTTLDDGREAEGTFAHGFGGEFVVDVKWQGKLGAQSMSFYVSPSSLVTAVLRCIEAGKAEELPDGPTTGKRASRVPS